MKAAFLGPEGSYSELALKEHLNPKVAVPCRSFAEIFRAVDAGEVDCGLVPIENMLQGPITENLDLLFEYHGRLHIESSYTLNIVHCLGVLPGVDPLSVTHVYSREQALRQCGKHLESTFSNAELVMCSSTGAAAREVKEKDLRTAAVIAAHTTLESVGLDVLSKDIADRPGNKTRFVVLRKGSPTLTETDSDKGSEFVTYVVVDPGKDRQGILHELLEVISITHGVNLKFIHSRPDPRGIFVFHLNLEGHFSEPRIRACIEALKEYSRTSTGETAEIIICGSYQQQPFQAPPFHTIGIVGGEGKMGGWFKSLFESAGLEVLVSEKDGGVSLEELSSKSDVVLLSVPMSVADEVARDICPHLRPGQLVVENCSVKSCALPRLLNDAPAGVEVLGIHTMFADDIESIRKQNIIVTKTERSDTLSEDFEAFLYKYGANVTHLAASQHDQLSAFFQSLFQCTMVGLAETMRQCVATPENIAPFSTPNSRAVLNTMRRVLNQNEDLLSDLQAINDQYPRIRANFLQNVFRLIMALEQGDVETFLESARKSKIFMDT